MNNLVVVESPTKARTLQRFLGDQYQIEASMGHVRDLPKSELGVDIENDFLPQYIIPRAKIKQVNQLKKTAKLAKTLWLATDPDREGEAIAWHIQQLLNNSQVKRVVFHEITEEAIKQAFAKPGELNMQLINAQQARRVLDRLVGYKLSPLLWQKVKRGLSAGRVQSVALRLIVEREREVTAFVAQEYWVIEAELKNSDVFIATLKADIKNEKEAKEHVKNLEKASYVVSKVTQKEIRRYPYPPFTTSTMQQASSNRLGFSAKKTMMLSQALYERGFITYMRTDSVNLSTGAVAAVRNYIGQNFGKKYIPAAARIYKSKSKNAQEAHEAIRPTDAQRQLSLVGADAGLTRDHARLYELIWKRFVACQMSEAVMDQTTVDVTARGSHPERPKGVEGSIYLLRATGSVIRFEGWLKLYGKEEETDEKNQVLPALKENMPLSLIKLLPSQHFTEAPPRYNEASLIKKLEELGIGRPSTYAPILSTIQERFYVEKQEKKFIPTVLGFAVSDFLIKYFPDVFDYQFTAQMEDKLDEIARGERQWRPTIREFYEPFEKKLEQTGETAEKVKVAVELAGKKCPKCGKDLIIRVGRFGKFLACSGFPDCKHTENLEEIINIKCPDDGGDIVVRHTKKRKTFYGCKNWPVCKFASWTKPKEAISNKNKE
ncbi:DNA topoisomerase I [Candidatus Daviesbacteria bacterium RIFCSPLOWO2_01_FULL_38_10]|nr:MAG: DNA topoisomerase I [Candidatus Daviesbacteria bacterium RIFCSPHIGHO2_02_FULL_39_41]OGE37307.1 MAG: DNA topoisomerase I [Candidatus Daviesbacteria bacterium RIFCSPLOWO2_01_FULL_38_10]OGE44855.1 MAG: DNA topoisomerase I [Candidatus Daviesbacteria bacterium RIFCSPHIGHO2_12_FULL_38_25]OGE68060.1 MAG: DNA topoisomerase I [Candidatus Daviesbacteria bacterium RIFCSPLOWO2_02_FULL_38_18]OGE71824.1 MAG: DNA topoisomerase I [Candidatus Daviesbacteria bacterium RIFCSPLOWO2_12_FULL_38_10]HBQ50715.